MIETAMSGRRVFTVAAVLLALGAACKPSDTGSNPADTDTGGTGTPVGTTDLIPDKGMPGFPTEDQEATRKYLMSIRWASDLPLGDVVDGDLLDDNNQKRKIRIVPSDAAFGVNWQGSINGTDNGYFVAKIYNREPGAIAALNIPAHQTGYLWVGRLNATQRGVAIVRVRHDGQATIAKTLSWDNYCAESHSRSRVELTEGKKCPARAGANTSASMPATVTLASNVGPAAATSSSFLAGLGLWITCSGGCCEVKMRQETN